MHFKDKVVWITGASSGIGAELAKQLAKQGARLVLTARSADKLAEVKKSCPTDCSVLPADLYQSDSLEALTKQAISTYGQIDVVIHSAGISQRSLATETDMKVYRELMEINFFSAVAITRYLLPHFEERNTGHIVALSSMAGLMGFPMRTGYAAAKHAVKGYFETLQTELLNTNIHTTIVSPGRINTPISMSALTKDGTPHSQMDDGQLNGIPVDTCAEKILDGVAKNKKHIVIATGERLLWWFWWFIPNLYYRIAHKKGMQ